MRVLTEADGMTLANLCQTWSTLVKAQQQLTEKGILYKTPSGHVQQSPLFSMVNQGVDTVTKLSREFGLTPAARSRIIAPAETDSTHDELAALLRAPREPRPKPTESVN